MLSLSYFNIVKTLISNRYDFLHDIELIYKNSLQYNGETSEYTMKAKKLLETTQETLDNYTDHLEVLEAKIREVQQRAIDQVCREIWKNFSLHKF